MSILDKALYKNAYPQLRNNQLPTQKYLGSIAYKPHTFDQIDKRVVYLPREQIVSFEWVSIIVDSNKKVENIKQIWNVTGL